MPYNYMIKLQPSDPDVGVTTGQDSATGPIRLLLVEDDATVRGMVRDHLVDRGYDVIEASNASEFRRYIAATAVDIVLLDLNLPDADGLDLLRELRMHKGQTPVFVVSGRRDDASRLAALEMAANDYIAKPFRIRELELRIRNFLMYRDSLTEGRRRSGGLRLGGWSVIPEQRTLHHDDGAMVTLSRGEMELLCVMLQGGSIVHTRDELLDALTRSLGRGSPETLTVLISRLRRKLAARGEQREYIVTVQGVGYRLQRP